MKFRVFYVIIILLVVGCSTTKLPAKKISQAEIPTPKFILKNKSLEIQLINPASCPIRFEIETNNSNLNNRLKELGIIELKAKSDTLVRIRNVSQFDQNASFGYNWRFGSLSKKITPIKMELPFPKGKKYKVIQGNNTNHTHNTEWSKFAVDFDLKINDTICSSTDGFVVGVVDQYKYGGKGDEWKSYGNFVTIYEPNSGIFTQYVHLTENGSLVKVGDKIKKGQPIGMSGMTGQTDIEHLHFNCLVPTNSEDGLKSIEFDFVGGYKSIELKKGDILEK
ncbi:M23 family metallopeptidase [Flavobacterium sp. CBA20B-1]|uniref:M23 family metallopeptidase n=1 Tax=unclassified Flavobacterium TaxID=196869 RepID=UPI0022241D19|nr:MULTISPECIES: M23 family metallopeptidase [unclassified Flavobacterium]WCM41656.1 M23 family metallopeptidase [Flavobacterium sp. CBA20B-1]